MSDHRSLFPPYELVAAVHHAEEHDPNGLAAAEAALNAWFDERLQPTTPLPFAPISAVTHEHEWVKVGEEHQGMTQIRTYECRGCLAHTTMTGPLGVRSPFDVEEST